MKVPRPSPFSKHSVTMVACITWWPFKEWKLPDDRGMADGDMFSFCTVFVLSKYLPPKWINWAIRKIEWSHWKMRGSSDQFSKVWFSGECAVRLQGRPGAVFQHLRLLCSELALHLHFPERVQTGHHLSYLCYSGKGGGWQPRMISTLDDRWLFCHNNRAISEPRARRKRGWLAPGWHRQAARVKKKRLGRWVAAIHTDWVNITIPTFLS